MLPLILILLSALFSSYETAIVYYPSYKIRDKIVRKLKEDLDKTLIAILIANNFVNVLISVLVTDYLVNQLGFLGILPATIIVTILIITFGEIIPKYLALARPELILKFAPLIYLVKLIFYPLVLFYHKLASLFGKANNKLSKTEIINIIDEAIKKRYLQELEGRMVKKLLTLLDMPVNVVKKPLSDYKLVSHPTNESFALIYKGDEENIVGYIRDNQILKPLYVPQNITIKTLLEKMVKSQKDLAIVVNEYGDAIGVIELDALLRDLLSLPDYNIDAMKEHRYIIVDGDENVNDINDKYNLNLPLPKNYSTIAGLILEKTHRIPKKGEKIRINNYVLEILDSDDKKINKVKIYI
ncbi:NEQ189 [Nanoarchaeum equitans Kin4-M]|uniref:NEQ189 n=1 Tax=Nanoarchaeum equitans (strain Kin4-M) TaxID=228908 RepID=Q74NC7_NANEQ|nr:NEQ189 [Nanoarchaeum equitans Kin4-M]